MRISSMKCGMAAILCLAISGGSAQIASSQEGAVTAPQLDNAQDAQAVAEYWTVERMQSAQPIPAPAVAMDAAENQAATQVSPAIPGLPGVAYGWAPGRAPAVQKTRIFDTTAAAEMAEAQYFGSAPGNPKDGPYGPFMRQTMAGYYLKWPAKTLGKLFFTLSGGNYVCSATVIGNSTIATAGHCVSSGAGVFATNVQFCPSYYNGGTGGAGIPFPTVGCWSAVSLSTSTAWHSSADPDSDYACAVMATTGTVVANKIGTVTGATGRAWNWGNIPVRTFGYPAAAPFVGNTIQQTDSTMWYGVDFTAGGQVSNAIGSDLTGGSSGGGWFIGWMHPNYEIPDTDGNNGTDPGGYGPYITGVNSHKRCLSNCNNPPTTTNGVFWQEMTSPPFLNSASLGESEDIFGICLNHANN